MMKHWGDTTTDTHHLVTAFLEKAGPRNGMDLAR